MHSGRIERKVRQTKVEDCGRPRRKTERQKNYDTDWENKTVLPRLHRNTLAGHTCLLYSTGEENNLISLPKWYFKGELWFAVTFFSGQNPALNEEWRNNTRQEPARWTDIQLITISKTMSLSQLSFTFCIPSWHINKQQWLLATPHLPNTFVFSVRMWKTSHAENVWAISGLDLQQRANNSSFTP